MSPIPRLVWGQVLDHSQYFHTASNQQLDLSRGFSSEICSVCEAIIHIKTRNGLI